jgi:hypothetical protein
MPCVRLYYNEELLGGEMSHQANHLSRFYEAGFQFRQGSQSSAREIDKSRLGHASQPYRDFRFGLPAVGSITAIASIASDFLGSASWKPY